MASLKQTELAELSREIELCRRCAERGYVAVPRPLDRGQARWPVWLIGQAPGFSEGERKVAFGGPAGRKLMSWFAQTGLSEADVRANFYLSAITKCYPGRAKGGGGDRNPAPEERALCRPYLLRELILLQPQVVILVGSTAIKEVYGEKVKLEGVIGESFEMTAGELYRRFSLRLLDGVYRNPPADFDPTAHLEIYPLPHPSGASTWLNSAANQALLQKALSNLKERFALWLNANSDKGAELE